MFYFMFTFVTSFLIRVGMENPQGLVCVQLHRVLFVIIDLILLEFFKRLLLQINIIQIVLFFKYCANIIKCI